MRVHFLPDLEQDLVLSDTPEHWTEAKFAAWLCRNVREPTNTLDLSFVGSGLSQTAPLFPGDLEVVHPDAEVGGGGGGCAAGLGFQDD